MAATGLRNRTGLATTTLILGANIPDVDVLAYLGGPNADLEFRRGWTHGILALALWPFVLTGAMLLLDRIGRKLRGAVLPSDVRPGQVLLLASLAVLSHPILDTLNTYGVRWLMPFSGRWFYGDTLFIVDPWMWLALGAGVVLSRRRSRRRPLAFHLDTGAPARTALLVCTVYVIAMAVAGFAARRAIARELQLGPDRSATALMASPVPVNPFARRFVAVKGDDYVVGRFRWLADPHVDAASLATYPRGRPDHPAVDAAVRDVAVRRFLGWARFPTFAIDSTAPDRYVVSVIDVRYRDRASDGFGSVSVAVPR